MAEDRGLADVQESAKQQDDERFLPVARRERATPQRYDHRVGGTADTLVLMTFPTSFAAPLLTLPCIQVVGCLLLLWIGIKLLLSEDDGGNVKESSSFRNAATTIIIIADIVMNGTRHREQSLQR